jgi:hypothetical protein
MEREPHSPKPTAEPPEWERGEADGGQDLSTIEVVLPEGVTTEDLDRVVAQQVAERVADIEDPETRRLVADAFEYQLRQRLPYLWRSQAKIAARRSA